jgi:hypothetical protein
VRGNIKLMELEETILPQDKEGMKEGRKEE